MRVPTVPDMHRLPLTVVGGDARTGKTTLLRQLVTQSHVGGVAVVFDGLEPPALDSCSPVQVDGPWTTLQNGSLCGALTGDLSAELAELRQRLPSTSHVLIEARDGALRRVAGYGYMPGYRPDGTVVVMNAQDMDDSVGKTDRREAMTARLRSADILVLNMMDVVPPAARARCQNWLDTEMSRLRVIETTHGRVASSLLLGVTPDEAKHDARAVSGTWESTTHSTAGRRRSISKTSASAEPPCRLWRIETDRPVAARQFRSWISMLPRSVVRGTGDVLIEEDPRLRYQFHMIGHRWHLRREEPWGHAAPETRVALVSM